MSVIPTLVQELLKIFVGRGQKAPLGGTGLRYHKIGLIPGQPSGNSDDKNPGAWVKSRCKALGLSGEGDFGAWN